MNIRQRIFERAWKRNIWEGRETPAGPGSSLGATVLLQDRLPALLQRLRIDTLLDAGCNEALWMPRDLGCEYVGVDIVPGAIAAARHRHEGWEGFSFLVADIVADELPTADAVLCRDVLQHLSWADGLAALSNLKRTGARWLLASSHVGDPNRDIQTGGWYPINLEAPPWDLGRPEWRLADGAWADEEPWPHKILGAWYL